MAQVYGGSIRVGQLDTEKVVASLFPNVCRRSWYSHVPKGDLMFLRARDPG